MTASTMWTQLLCMASLCTAVLSGNMVSECSMSGDVPDMSFPARTAASTSAVAMLVTASRIRSSRVSTVPVVDDVFVVVAIATWVETRLTASTIYLRTGCTRGVLAHTLVASWYNQQRRDIWSEFTFCPYNPASIVVPHPGPAFAHQSTSLIAAKNKMDNPACVSAFQTPFLLSISFQLSLQCCIL